MCERSQYTCEPVLRVGKLSKSYGDQRALFEISLELGKGEVLGVIGPSGSGKTTLLRCLDVLESFEAGMVEYVGAFRVCGERGRPAQVLDLRTGAARAFTESIACKIRRNLGYVFQGYALWNERTR
jgi:ABC-type polar amino acid transport system ATPase subunit